MGKLDAVSSVFLTVEGERTAVCRWVTVSKGLAINQAQSGQEHRRCGKRGREHFVCVSRCGSSMFEVEVFVVEGSGSCIVSVLSQKVP
jgi:hypothetical protein